jgi:hypothetical protein
LSISTDRGELGRWNHGFDGFFAFSQQQVESRQKPDILWDHRFSTSSTNPYSGLCKLGSGDGPDIWKPKVSRWFLGFNSPLRLSKSDPSAGKAMTMAISESSVGSSSEVNSPVSFTTTENMEDKIKELDETMENLHLGEQAGDFIYCGNISDKSTDTWKIGLELHEDDQTTFSSCSSKFDK